MSLRICSLSSGSSGNCTFVATEKTCILIDAGIPSDRIKRSLRVLKADKAELSVLVTHAHTDHISNLAFAGERGARVYAHFLSAPSVVKRGKFAFTEFGDAEFSIGDISVTPFFVPHDIPCVGFTLRNQDRAVSILTDLGEADANTVREISNSDVVFIESNHDEALLQRGPYPWPLKKRILSRQGHLSNAACAETCAKLVAGRARQIILAHLSRENNYPELAFNTVAARLSAMGCVEGKDFSLEVAPAYRMSGLYEIC
ncbi:MAG: MBL fold metallo-hydrolase [Firmicutes bacterium]|nr:MBL fold metallo-hydrolase [Bacillota bacterium]